MDSYIERNFEDIFNLHYTPMCSFLNLYTRDKAIIEDVLQDIFCSLWADRNTLQIEKIKSYLYTTARNRILNHLRNEKLRKELLTLWIHDEAELSRFDDCVRREETEQILKNAIDSLSSRNKYIFVLNKLEGLSYKEIAAKESITVKAVEKHITASLKKIRQFIL